jgi:hypothetical protein
MRGFWTAAIALLMTVLLGLPEAEAAKGPGGSRGQGFSGNRGFRGSRPGRFIGGAGRGRALFFGRFSNRVWSPRFGAFVYWSPAWNGWYRWDGGRGSWVGVTTPAGGGDPPPDPTPPDPTPDPTPPSPTPPSPTPPSPTPPPPPSPAPTPGDDDDP